MRRVALDLKKKKKLKKTLAGSGPQNEDDLQYAEALCSHRKIFFPQTQEYKNI